MTDLKYPFIRRCDNPYCSNDVGNKIRHCCKTCRILTYHPHIRSKLTYLDVKVDGNESLLPIIIDLVNSERKLKISSCIKLK